MNKKEFIKKYKNNENDSFVMHIDDGVESISTVEEVENEWFEEFVINNDCEHVKDHLDFNGVISGYEDNYDFYTYNEILSILEKEELKNKMEMIKKIGKVVEETFGYDCSDFEVYENILYVGNKENTHMNYPLKQIVVNIKTKKIEHLLLRKDGEFSFTKEEIKMDKNFVAKLNKILEEENE